MRVILCDDDKKDIARYQAIIRKIADKLQIPLELHICYSASQLLFEMDNKKGMADVLFLDILMPPGPNGLLLAEKLRETYEYKGEIVFISNSAEFVWNAFDVSAAHYIVKKDTLPKKQSEIISGVLTKASEKKKEYLLLKGVGEYRNIKMEKIYYIESKGRLSVIHYGDDEVFEFYATFERLENTLLIYEIVRVHRSFLVAVDKIKSFSYKEIVLDNGMKVPIGRKYQSNLRSAMGVD